MNSRQKQLGLTGAIFNKSNTIMENALSGGKHLTREELLAELGQAKIALDENRASHLLARAELDGILCSGATKGGKQTYALLAERVQKLESFTKEESLAKLAKKYFTSHCPATLQDFTWWSGSSAGLARNALEMIRSDFVSETINSQIPFPLRRWIKTLFIYCLHSMNLSSATQTGVQWFLMENLPS